MDAEHDAEAITEVHPRFRTESAEPQAAREDESPSLADDSYQERSVPADDRGPEEEITEINPNRPRDPSAGA